MATVAGEMPPARTIALMTPIAAAATALHVFSFRAAHDGRASR